MDQDYKVVKVSQKEPRTWDGPNGRVYYISVMLEGHDKPVSVGKKEPNSIHEGDVIFGHILAEQSFPEDKWKPGKKPFGGAVGGSGYSKPAYKDNSDGQRQGMCFNNAANYVNGLTALSKKPLTFEEWAGEVYNYANALYKLGDLGGSEDTNPKPVAQTTSNPARLKQGDPVWPSDNEDPEWASMMEAGLRADGIDPSEIPF